MRIGPIPDFSQRGGISSAACSSLIARESPFGILDSGFGIPEPSHIGNISSAACSSLLVC